MAKKQRKKSIKVKKIVFAAIILIVLFVAGYYVLNYQKEKANNKEINKFLYDLLACNSNCSIKLVIGQNSTKVVFDDVCLSGCQIQSMGQNPEYFLKNPITSKNADKLISASPELLACRSSYNMERNADKYKACLQEVLPILKERYGIS